MTKLFLCLALLGAVALNGPAQNQSAPAVSSQQAFFENLKKLCGKKFAGATDFPQNTDHPMVGKQLVMHVAMCGDKEFRIPFHVGADRSRTWILTLTKEGLLFKHDHRHEDGTPDKITNYGGLAASAGGSPHLQRFPADGHTATLIPEAKTNVWTLAIDADKQQFMYYLERNNEPRFRAYFDLSKPLKL
ncbi:hypothetical protein BH18ACI2_BH18ACI2_01050 [soil metagenome]